MFPAYDPMAGKPLATCQANPSAARSGGTLASPVEPRASELTRESACENDQRRSPLSFIKAFRESLSLLATRRFGTFWFASLLSSIGTWAQQVAEPWLLLTLGASSFLIGLASSARNAPISNDDAPSVS